MACGSSTWSPSSSVRRRTRTGVHVDRIETAIRKRFAAEPVFVGGKGDLRAALEVNRDYFATAFARLKSTGALEEAGTYHKRELHWKGAK